VCVVARIVLEHAYSIFGAIQLPGGQEIIACCNSSVLGRGVLHAYDIVVTDSLDLSITEAAWWGALALACSTSLGFVFLMSLLTDLVPT
jgi:hypothetical protein